VRVNITITGPRSVGKTTISKKLAKKMKMKRISSDEIGNKALEKEGGLDKATKSGKIEKIIQNSGYSLIKKVYDEETNFVFDLSGGSVSSIKFSKISEEVRNVAKSNSLIIGLLPSENEKDSVDFLFERERKRDHFKNFDLEELFAKTKKSYEKFPPLFEKFCDILIYVKEKTDEEIVKEIYDKI
tara:strand:+ start:292 stop:846 length:555 start_codon:yes stop_codon:yes gene_type:complete